MPGADRRTLRSSGIAGVCALAALIFYVLEERSEVDVDELTVVLGKVIIHDEDAEFSDLRKNIVPEVFMLHDGSMPRSTTLG